MKRLNLIKDKLNDAGYYVGLREFGGVKHLFGGIQNGEEEGSLKLGVEIRIHIEEGKIVLYEAVGQTYKKIEFQAEDNVVAFVKKKFPL